MPTDQPELTPEEREERFKNAFRGYTREQIIDSFRELIRLKREVDASIAEWCKRTGNISPLIQPPLFWEYVDLIDVDENAERDITNGSENEAGMCPDLDR